MFNRICDMYLKVFAIEVELAINAGGSAMISPTFVFLRKHAMSSVQALRKESDGPKPTAAQGSGIFADVDLQL